MRFDRATRLSLETIDSSETTEIFLARACVSYTRLAMHHEVESHVLPLSFVYQVS